MGLFVMGLSSPGQAAGTFFADFFLAGGPVVWFVLLPMSVITVYMAVELCFLVRRKRLMPTKAKGQEIFNIIARYGLSSLPAGLEREKDLVSRAVAGTAARTAKISPSGGLLRQTVEESVQEQCLRLLRKTDWCGLAGNVAPMVGLFGTVYGMIRAFNILGLAEGQPQPGQLAESISIALVTTFWGLLVAIPALFIAGFFRTRIEGLAAEAVIEAETILERISQTAAAKTTDGGKVVSIHRSQPQRTGMQQTAKEAIVEKPAATETKIQAQTAKR